MIILFHCIYLLCIEYLITGDLMIILQLQNSYLYTSIKKIKHIENSCRPSTEFEPKSSRPATVIQQFSCRPRYLNFYFSFVEQSARQHNYVEGNSLINHFPCSFSFSVTTSVGEISCRSPYVSLRTLLPFACHCHILLVTPKTRGIHMFPFVFRYSSMIQGRCHVDKPLLCREPL